MSPHNLVLSAYRRQALLTLSPLKTSHSRKRIGHDSSRGCQNGLNYNSLSIFHCWYMVPTDTSRRWESLNCLRCVVCREQHPLCVTPLTLMRQSATPWRWSATPLIHYNALIHYADVSIYYSEFKFRFQCQPTKCWRLHMYPWLHFFIHRSLKLAALISRPFAAQLGWRFVALLNLYYCVRLLWSILILLLLTQILTGSQANIISFLFQTQSPTSIQFDSS